MPYQYQPPRLAEATECELAEAKFLHNRLVATDWDATLS